MKRHLSSGHTLLRCLILLSALALLAASIGRAFAQCNHCVHESGPVIYSSGICPFDELASGQEVGTQSLQITPHSGACSCISFAVSYGSCPKPHEDDSFYWGATWSIDGGDATGLEMSSGGMLCVVGDPCDVKPGSITIKVADFDGHEVTATVTVNAPADCEDSTSSGTGGGCGSPGGCGPGGSGGDIIAASPTYTGSAAAVVKLGRGAFGKKLGSLVIHEKMPMADLCTPKCLQVPYASNAYCKVITNAYAIRQVKVTEGLVDIITNAAHKYTVNVYPTNGIGATNADGTYNVSGPTIASITVENPDISCATSNRLKITDGEGLVSDFEYTATGWELTKGGGASKRKKTSALSESDTLNTVTNELRNSTNGLVSVKRAKYKTYAAVGTREIESALGTGAEAITNIQSWYTNVGSYTAGLLQQVNRADGYWEINQYETNRFATNVIKAFLNQAPTSNGTLARQIVSGYGSNVVAGAGDNGLRNPFSPRATIEYVLGKEVSRSYLVWLKGERRDIRCVTPGAAWDAADNLVTITKYYTNGDFQSWLWTVENPDGTILVKQHYKSADGQYMTNVTMTGAPDATKTNVTDGTKTISVRGHVNQQVSRTEIDIASGITNSHEIYSDFDYRNRARKVTYLDGTFTWTDYGCCGPINFTNREGTAFKTHRDALNRQAALQNIGLNITTTNIYDGGKNLAQRRRIGSDGSSVTNVSYTYDTAGRITSSADALGNVTSFSEIISNSQVIKTTTYPDGGTRIEEFYRDGQHAKLTGTAVHPVRYDYGVEQDGGVWRLYTKEIKLDASGNDTSEWVKTYRDMLGRSYKVAYPDGATYQRFYNTKGQITKEVDPDGVTTMFAYNARAELEYTAVDMNRNGSIDFNGTDRIRQSARTVTSNNGFNVQQTRTYSWSTNNSAISNLIATIEIGTDGLRSWNNSFGLTNKTQRVFAGSGNRYETNTAPNGSFTTSQFQHGQPLSTTKRDANGAQIEKTTFTYDPHGRRSTSTDARNGITSYSYDAADHLASTRTPMPGNGQDSQVTSYVYDFAGRVTQTTLPDKTAVYNVYSTKGELLTNYGSRVYPVSYAYDPQGRRTNMVTWTNFANRAGAAITWWKFDGLRGFMTNQVFADGNGPSYTYTSAGRLRTRKWARGVTTTYETNALADLVGITYSDGTSNVTYNLDRLGRRTNAIDGAGTRFLSYTPSGLLLLETNAGGVLAGTATGRQYDQYQRRTNLAIYTPGSTINHSYSYDSASRLSTVSDGIYNATYDYLANSPLVSQITFRSNSAVRMTTSKKYDFLNRLVDLSSVPSASSAVRFSYAYNDANQLTRRTDTDESYWAYEYDSFGQVTSSKRYWPDSMLVAGQQFEYVYDDIGNRRKTKEGGDASGSGLRTANYTVNNLNQYTQCEVPGAADIIGIAHPSASVTVNAQSAHRHREYYHKELAIDNSSAPVWQAVTNKGTYSGQTDTNIGNLLLPKTPQLFFYDSDGNTLSDLTWTNRWDGENHMLSAENTLDIPELARAKEVWAFDDQGRWIQRTIYSWNAGMYTAQATNRFLWNGMMPIATLDHNNAISATLMRGLDLSGSLRSGVGSLLTINIVTNGYHFPAYDGNGNVSALAVAASGVISGTYEFHPFGNTLRLTGAAAKANLFRFSTQFADEILGSTKWFYRDHQLRSVTWANRDPIGELAHRIWQRQPHRRAMLGNLYQFLQNNPNSNYDPDGRWVAPVIGVGVGIGLGYCLDRLGCRARVAGALLSAEAEADASAPDGTTHRDGPNPTEGGDADALTHCIAGCNLARSPYPCFGPDGALAQLQAREQGNAIGTQLDRMNNENGIGVGMSLDPGGNCRDACLDALRRGLLNEIDNGRIVPSSE